MRGWVSWDIADWSRAEKSRETRGRGRGSGGDRNEVSAVICLSLLFKPTKNCLLLCQWLRGIYVSLVSIFDHYTRFPHLQSPNIIIPQFHHHKCALSIGRPSPNPDHLSLDLFRGVWFNLDFSTQYCMRSGGRIGRTEGRPEGIIEMNWLVTKRSVSTERRHTDALST